MLSRVWGCVILSAIKAQVRLNNKEICTVLDLLVSRTGTLESSEHTSYNYQVAMTTYVNRMQQACNANIILMYTIILCYMVIAYLKQIAYFGCSSSLVHTGSECKSWR